VDENRHEAEPKADWQQYCMECSIPLEEGMKKCPKCGWRIIDAHALLEIDPTSKLTRKKYTRARRVDTYIVVFIHIVLVFSLAGSLGLLSRNLGMLRINVLTDEGPDFLSRLSYWFLVYSILAIFALFALYRIGEVINRYHEARMNR
jgi:hypothetical protein